MARKEGGWSLLSAHGLVLVGIVRLRNPTVMELAETVGLSKMTVIRALHNLREAGMIEVQRAGRRNLYSVKGDVSFRHRSMRDSQIAVLVDAFRKAATVRTTRTPRG